LAWLVRGWRCNHAPVDVVLRRRGSGRAHAARDHWQDSGCVLLAGGGLRVGQVIGVTDRHAAAPRTAPLTPQIVLATLYRLLGIDPAATIPDFTGRPMPVLDDHDPIAELL
jgi:hypothetical protein